jgi:hypothetical protein
MAEDPVEASPAVPRKVGGIFITRGMSFGVRDLEISIGPDGESKVNATFHASLDTCPYWLEIASRHARDAMRAHKEVLSAWESDDGDRKATALEAEFTSGMQSVVASAIAVDAFYALVRPHVPIPEAMTRRWRTGRTARHRQIAEVLRRAFHLKPKGTAFLRQNLEQLFRFRDRAVHPPATLEAPVVYAEIGVATEWRFVAFNHHAARNAFPVALSLVAQLSEHRSRPAAIREQLDATRQRVAPLVDEWEQQFGQLYQRQLAST